MLCQSGVRGVVKGAQHPGDIAERRAFHAALGEGARGFALEVDDDEIPAGFEHLAEMVVAVMARLRRDDFVLCERGKASQDFVFTRQQRSRRGTSVFGNVGELFAQEFQRAPGGRARGVGERAEVLRAEGLRREGRIGGVRREREVHLRGAPSELARAVGIRIVCAVALEGLVERGEREGPRIPLARHVRHDERKRARFAGGGTMLDGSAKRGDVWKLLPFAQKAEQLGIGIFARLRLAVEL